MHIVIGKNGRGHGHHVRQRGITEQDGVQALRDRQGNRGCWLRSRQAHTIIAPVTHRRIAVHQGELETRQAVEVHVVHDDPSLIVQKLRHVR